MFLSVLKQLCIMLIIAVSSFIVTKKFKFGKTEQQFVSKILLLYINPCLILTHFDVEFNSDKLLSFGIAAILAVIVHFAMILVASVFCRSKDEEGKQLDCIDKIGTVMTNCGFIGIPLIDGVIGHDGVFYLLSFIATFNVMLWTWGFHLMAGKANFKKIITNPNIICVILGLILFCLPVRLPEIISKPMNLIGSMNTAMAMVLLGMLFANFQKNPSASYGKRLVKICILRHIACGIVVFAVIFGFFRLLEFLGAQTWFPAITDLRTICVVAFIAALCPTGMSVSSFSVIFNKDQSYAALICMVTSAVCVVTLPLSVLLFEQVI